MYRIGTPGNVYSVRAMRQSSGSPSDKNAERAQPFAWRAGRVGKNAPPGGDRLLETDARWTGKATVQV